MGSGRSHPTGHYASSASCACCVPVCTGQPLPTQHVHTPDETTRLLYNSQEINSTGHRKCLLTEAFSVREPLIGIETYSFSTPCGHSASFHSQITTQGLQSLTHQKTPVWGVFFWSRGPGLNRRPVVYDTTALPTELPRQISLQGPSSFLGPLTRRAVLSPIPSICASVGGRKRITVWTNKSKICFDIVSPVSVDMVSNEGNNSCCEVRFCPTTKTALISVLLTQITFDVSGYYTQSL